MEPVIFVDSLSGFFRVVNVAFRAYQLVIP